ncbi:hypothetical protein OG259_36710 [Streptomyces sp. NBC_00250]|uniref:hypothetical protein n=1 Tax=Streptomyces sp. NBC_00250 TaxID=2903641 RepID=UPI002E29873C|nr:hypothetical protein [Streptomyces sp. NBC_00250]
MEEPTRREEADPEVRKRVQDGFDRQGLMAHLGARLSHIGPGVAEDGTRRPVANGRQTLIRVDAKTP